MGQKNIYIIAGCNGAGKTTASYTILPDILNCREFVNADEIAKGLSPFQPDKVAFEAGRIMLQRMDELIRMGVSFAFETTLAAKTYHGKMDLAKGAGYQISLVYFWLESVELAKARVKMRVKAGGHDIPDEVIKRRFYRGIHNLFELYLQSVDNLLIFDNSEGKHELLAQKKPDEAIDVLNLSKFNQIKVCYEWQKKMGI